MKTFICDLETFSSADIKRTGATKYAEAEDFEILLMSYAFDDDPVAVWDVKKEGFPDWLPQVLTDETVTKVAWNYGFERACFNAALGIYTPPEQWRDAMTIAAMNGLPLSLEDAGEALEITDKKLDSGKALIAYFCRPCKPTISNGGRTRNLPEHAPEKWEKFIEYCRRDSEAERTIYNILRKLPVTDFERSVEALDARINERGVQIDTALVASAIYVDEALRAENTAELKRLTGLENPNSVSQLKEWLAENGVDCESLNKDAVAEMTKTVTDKTIKRVLELRQQLGKTSTKKYQAMLDAVCKDGRIRGLLQYYGAARTGRWAGRRVQLQNLAQNHLASIGTVREIVRDRDLEMLEMLYANIPDVLSQLIRTALVAKSGHTFLVADYSAIEARVINYLACEQWAMDAFANGEDIYCKTASRAFGVPVEKHGVNGHLRQRGKVMVLGLGYGMGASRFVDYAANYGLQLSADEAKELVDQWRLASPSIPRLWRRVEDAAKAALMNPGRRCTVLRKERDPSRSSYNESITGGRGYSQDFLAGGTVCTFWRDKDALRCKLPSGRILTYWRAGLVDGRIEFMAQNQETRKWERDQTWGGKLVENVVQAIARDCLAVAMLRLDEAGYRITFHVHDEIIAEAPEGSRWEDMADVMGRPIEWAPGLLLRGDGYCTDFYLKD